MVLFLTSTALAWIYFKRFKSLQAQLAQDDANAPGAPSRGVDELAGGVPGHEESTQRESNAEQARQERRQRRRRELQELREQQGISNLDSIPEKADQEELTALRPAKTNEAEPSTRCGTMCA